MFSSPNLFLFLWRINSIGCTVKYFVLYNSKLRQTECWPQFEWKVTTTDYPRRLFLKKINKITSLNHLFLSRYLNNCRLLFILSQKLSSFICYYLLIRVLGYVYMYVRVTTYHIPHTIYVPHTCSRLYIKGFYLHFIFIW